MRGPNKTTLTLEGKPKEPLQCWGCGENHRLNDCPCSREDPRGLYNMEDAPRVEDMVRETPRLYVALEDQQSNH